MSAESRRAAFAELEASEAAAAAARGGASPQQGSTSGWMLLHACAEGEHFDVEYILASGANIAYRDVQENTPLHLACKFGQTRIVEILLAHGANNRARNRDGLTPEMCAEQHKKSMRLSHSPTLHCLRQAKAQTALEISAKEGAGRGNAGNAIKNAVMCGNLKELNRVLHAAMGGSEHSPTKIPIHYHVNYQDAIFKHTALHLPDWDGNSHRECVQRLLELGASPQLQNAFGWTPLHSACFYNHAEYLAILLGSHCDITLETDEGLTALDIAKVAKAKECISLLGNYAPSVLKLSENAQFLIYCRKLFCILDPGNSGWIDKKRSLELLCSQKLSHICLAHPRLHFLLEPMPGDGSTSWHSAFLVYRCEQDPQMSWLEFFTFIGSSAKQREACARDRPHSAVPYSLDGMRDRRVKMKYRKEVIDNDVSALGKELAKVNREYWGGTQAQYINAYNPQALTKEEMFEEAKMLRALATATAQPGEMSPGSPEDKARAYYRSNAAHHKVVMRRSAAKREMEFLMGMKDRLEKISIKK